MEEHIISEPSEHIYYSEQFKLRLLKTLHKSLAEHAKTDGLGMNQYCIYLLSKIVFKTLQIKIKCFIFFDEGSEITMKTKEELNALKNEIEELNNKLKELTEDELKEINGGSYDEDIRKYIDGLINPEYAYNDAIINKNPSYKPLP